MQNGRALTTQRLNRMIQDYFSSFLEIIVNETAGDGLMVIFQSEEGRVRHALNAAGRRSSSSLGWRR